MIALFHRAASLSIAAMLVTAALPAAAAPARPYFGRWTLNTNETLSSRGREYKTFDIAPCGRDFCGVSVNPNGSCGATLFRFLMKRADGKDSLRGHAKWGNARKNMVAWLYDEDGEEQQDNLQLYVGDGYDFGERSENMPKFDGTYRKSGVARCTAR